MSNPSSFLDLVRHVFRPAHSGVVDLVDDLLGLCSEQGLELVWRADACHVRSLGVEPEESLEVPLPKSVFRAVLARLATLCNERNPGSVSPYGGEGELMVGVDGSKVCRVTFTNTSSEQRLRVTRVGQDNQAGELQRPQQPVLGSDPRLPASAAR
jgi:hypothetical protein